MKHIYLLRHEEVEAKYKHCYNGHIDIKLSLRGKIRAKRVVQKLNQKKFDAIYCSDLLRTKSMLHDLNQKTKPIFTKSLREKSWGEHEGMNYEKLSDLGLEYKNFYQWIELLDGESINSFKKRIFNIWNQIAQTKSKNILVITHSGVIKTILSFEQNLTLKQAFHKEIPYGTITHILKKC